MGSRPGVIANATVCADGGREPNKYIPYVSAYVRVHWPPLATDQEIDDALQAAVRDARRQIERLRSGRTDDGR